MSTETATITGVRKEKIIKTGERKIDVEVTFTLGRGKSKVEEVRRFMYPAGTDTAEVEADLAKMIETRAQEREQAESQAALDAEDEAISKTVSELEGMKVTQK